MATTSNHPTCLFRQQEAAAPACGGKGSVAGGELPAQTPASQRPLSESRVPDALPADRTGTVTVTVTVTVWFIVPSDSYC